MIVVWTMVRTPPTPQNIMKAWPLVGLFYIYIMKDKKKLSADYYIGLGLCFGVAFGAALDNLGLGIALGLVFGAAIQQYKKKKDKS